MAFPGRERVVHLCLHPSDDKTSLASFFFESASDGRKQAGSVGAQQCRLLSLRGWEGQPPSAVLGKHAYQHRGHQVPGKAIYLSPPSALGLYLWRQNGECWSELGLPTLKGAQFRKGNTT